MTSDHYPGGIHPAHVREIAVGGRVVRTDAEGYLIDRGEWSEDFARALATREGLTLTDEHWQVIRFLRDHFRLKGRQAPIPHIIKHFRPLWGPERANARHLFALFEQGGGADRLGYRLAGIGRRKGEG